MRVQPIRTLAAPVERTEQAAFDHLKRRRLDLAGPHRRVDVAVVLGAADVDANVAGVQLDVLVALDAFDAQVAGREADVEVGLLRNLDGDPEPLVARGRRS